MKTQASRLLPSLFEQVDQQWPLTVLNVGPALPETVEFFSAYRCKIHFADLYPELPLRADEDRGITLDRCLEDALELPGGALFDLCFFWDALNFLSNEAVGALAAKLRPHLHPDSRAHCFAVHNSKTPAATTFHGIADAGHFSVRTRVVQPPDYQPHPQGELVSRLRFFQVDRSVLMPDRRIELVLNARL
ncbi:hypothetical protein [Parahaliea mediterranea]|uniref:Uncharacterized protein n=1 Tax=Parahaliea mediterranea TaxID=651086 RepID=A0A939IN49_9GAMM|nr:hypothetical protein [Parahaliea mediterranea]MBN7798195.1 hypothetical protein [Parahaliea mediterranea]